MSNPELHPNVEKFKTFVQDHPGLVKEVRNGNHKWQHYYEEWILLGENDPSWEKYRQISDDQRTKTSTGENKKNKDWMKQMAGMMEKVDLNKMEGHIEQLNGAITSIQSLVAQYQDVKKQITSKSSNPPPMRRPFYFNQD